MNFIEVGLEQRKKQERDKDAARRREEQVRRFRAVAVVALVGSVVAVSLAAYAWRQRAQANEQRAQATEYAAIAEKNRRIAEDARNNSEASEKKAIDESENAKKFAEVARRNMDEALKQTARTNSLILASKAQNLAERYPVRSILLASQAILTARGEEKGALLNVEAENVLRRTLGTISGTGLGGIGGNFSTVAYSPDGKTLAAGYGGVGGGVVLWDVATRLLEGSLSVVRGDGLGGGVNSVAFSPDGKTLAAGYGGDYNADVVLWDVATRKRLPGDRLWVPALGVNSLAFSPDGKTLAAGHGAVYDIYGGVGGGVVLWDVATRRRSVLEARDPAKGEQVQVHSVAFSPDGKTLAAGYGYVSVGGGVVLWDVAGRKRLSNDPLPVKEGHVSGVAFSPDGKTIAAGYSGVGVGGIVLWDVAGRKRLEYPLTVAEGGISRVTFSGDGKTLAASYNGPARGGVILWDVAARQRLGSAPLLAGEGGVSGVAFRPDGREIVAANGSGLRLWDLANGPPGVAEPRTLDSLRSLTPNDYAASPDGTWLVEASMTTACAWRLPVPDSRNVEPTDLSLEGIYIYDPVINKWEILFNRTGRRLAIVGARRVGIWESSGTITAKPRRILYSPSEFAFHSPVLSPDGRWLSLRSFRGTGELVLYDLNSDKGGTTDALFTRTLKPAYAAAESKETTKSETSKGTNQLQHVQQQAQQPKPASPKLEVTNQPGFGSDKSPRQLPPGVDSPAPAVSPAPEVGVAFSQDGRWMAACNRNDEIIFWNLESAKPAESSRVITVAGPVTAVVFHPKEPVLVATYLDLKEPNLVRVVSWQIEDGGAKLTPDPKHEISIDLDSKALTPRDAALSFVPDGTLLVVQSNLRPQIFHWAGDGIAEGEGLVNTSSSLLTNLSRSHPEFSPDSHFLLIPSALNEVALLDRSSSPYAWFNPFAVTKSGNLGDFSRDSRLVATVANDDSVHVSKLEELRQHLDPAESPRLDRIFAGMPAPIRLVRFDPTGSQLVTVAGDGVIRIWRLDTDKLLEAARRVAGRNLTRAEWKQYFPGLAYTRTFPDLPEPPLSRMADVEEDTR